MGEWSDYFEDFPEEAPTPPSAEEIVKKQLHSEIKNINSDAFALIAKANKKQFEVKQAEKKLSIVTVEECPQCGLKELDIYKLSDASFLCECQDCGIYGQGDSLSSAIEKTADALGEGLDWNNGSLFWVTKK
jgi:hypothetical protein